MPEHSGDILRMRRYTRLETAPVPINPSMMNPPSQLLTAVDIDAKIDWYATYLVVTKQVTLINQDPILNEASARLGQSLRETEDQLIRDMLEATASVINCVGGTNARIVGVLKSSLIELELSARDGGDNNAQAIERCAA
jgi:N4-gp56 family major capsid protein